MATSIYDFTVRDIQGKDQNLADYKGKVVLIVNVASKCGLTPQYEGLQDLFLKYEKQGLVILGFPANNFLWQEPGSDEQIQEFCTTKYDVTFPMFSKIDVKGKKIHPLYKYLTTESAHPGKVSWNFQKFLIDRNGQVIANIGPRTKPEEIVPVIEQALKS